MENMKTIAVIESCDTKFKEAKFISDFIKNEGLNALVINTATGPAPSYNYDISREEIAESYGTPWEEMEPKSKGEKIDYMKDAVAAYVVKLYEEGKIDGIISVGGLQNTVMAANAMQKLPIGFPKVMATTVASGTRKFDLVVGDKDITVMPAICDFTGLNIVTRQVISNACACCVGMVKCAGQVLTKGDKPVVAVTLMGVTNTGAVAAVEELEKMGLEVIGFHATGVGGATMEDMAANGLVDGILDLTLHELTSEYFGGGFSYGPKAKIRLVESVEKKVPLVISLGGLDFVDFSTSELPDRMDERKYMLHNANTAHIKILPEEAEALGKILAERLSKVTYPVKLLIPTKGMRHNTLEGPVMAANAMQKLPIGFPKVMATTVASGTRKFDLVVGDKDITVMPAICDFTGLNIVTRQVISNACACCVGMVKCAGQVLTKGDKPVVAVTLMGVTNTGAVAAVEELEKMGLEVIGFHATGVGGATMEDMAANGLVDGILDLTLHELTSEYFGGGFSYGPKAKIRLVESVEKKIPLVISLGGLDFVDFSTSELPDRMDERKYMLHNANTAHIKILPEEAEALGKILAERLSKVTYPVKLLIPTKGMRHNTLEGQELYEPKSDSVLIQTIIENVNDNVEVIVIPHNLDTPEFGVKAAHYIVDEMKKQGKLPQDFGEN